MSQTLTETPYFIDEEEKKKLDEAVENLVTEDDEPVDNIFSEKQQRLLTEPLYSSWTPRPDADRPDESRPFIAAANVGIFPSVHQPPLVPDMFLSLDVEVPERWYEKSKRSYFFWEFGKAPELVVEVVSNRKGNELGSKLRDYARIGVRYYVVYDPTKQLSDETLHVYGLGDTEYELRPGGDLPGIGLSAVLWTGSYETKEATWLRWCDTEGNLIPTGAERAAEESERAKLEAERARLEAERANCEAERANHEAERADHETERADHETERANQEAMRANQEAERANQEAERAARLAAKLRDMGINPDEI